MVPIWVVVHIVPISRYILTIDFRTYNKNVELLHPYQRVDPFLPTYLDKAYLTKVKPPTSLK